MVNDIAVQDLVNSLKEEPTDTNNNYTATVSRVDEEGVVWVHIYGSEIETPVASSSVSVDSGDKVSVNWRNNKIYVTGNMSAPAVGVEHVEEASAEIMVEVQEQIDESFEELEESIEETIEEALEDFEPVDDVSVQYCLSSSSTTFSQYGDWSDEPPEYVSGYYYWTRTVLYDDEGNERYGTPQYSQSTQLTVETDVAFRSNNNHFWYDSSGAYVTTSNKSYSSGYATRITASGILQSYNGNLLSSWTNSGINFYQGDSSNTVLASFGSNTTRIGKTSGNYIELSNNKLKFFDGSNSTTTPYGAISGVYGTYSKLLQIGTLTDDYNYGTVGVDSSSSPQITLTACEGSRTSYTYSSLTLKTTGWSLGTVDYASSSTDVRNVLQLFNDKLALYSGGNTDSYINFQVIPSTGETTISGRLLGVSSRNLINNSASSGQCRVGNTSDDLYLYGVATGTNGNALKIDGKKLYTSGSSKRFKHDISKVKDDELDPKRLYDIEVVQFVFNDDYLPKEDRNYGKPIIGFIAEDVYDKYPLGATLDENGLPSDWDDRYIIPPMLALIQEQNKRIKKLEEKVL